MILSTTVRQRFLCLLCALATLSHLAGFSGNEAIPDKPKTHAVTLNGHTFTLPEGFEIELAAGPDLVKRPITIDFDEQGRLYVSESAGVLDRADVQQQKKLHRILRLEDTDGDGKFDRGAVFADHVAFPEGTMWFKGSLYVAAPPSIWRLTDTDGDGVADKREEWFAGKTLTGCANDLHGPYRGPDGWIYWCKGAFASQTYELPRKRPFSTRAAHIFRARPDGTGIEPVMTGGMDNPVDVVFTPGGERIFSTTFFQHPGGGHRDGLVHAVYGGVYGKDHDPVYDHPWTGPSLLPVLTHLGPAAPCGLTRLEGTGLGVDYRDSLFVCQFNMRKVSRHSLVPVGATFTTLDEDFLVSDNVDFHPTDVIEDADGSLLVVDTGGWYKLCCPSSQLVKTDVFGGIYRIRRTGAAKVDDPRGLNLKWNNATPDELSQRMADERPAVVRRASEQVAGFGAAGVEPLARFMARSKSAEHRGHAAWALCRIDQPGARAVLRKYLADPDETVRQIAIHAAAVWRDIEAIPDLTRTLAGSSRQNRRAAAEALGRIGKSEAVPALLKALGDDNDRFVEHSLIYALIEIGDTDSVAAGTKSNNDRIKRGALIALNQISGKNMTAEPVIDELRAKNSDLREAAGWIAGRHPEWGAKLAGYYRERLRAFNELPPADKDELSRQLVSLAANGEIQRSLAEPLKLKSSSAAAAKFALGVMRQASIKQVPDCWTDALTKSLQAPASEVLPDLCVTVRSLPWGKQRPAALIASLLEIGGDEKHAASARLAALAAVPGGLRNLPDGPFRMLIDQVDRDKPAADRANAAEALARGQFTSEHLSQLARVIKTVGPMEIARTLTAFDQSKDERVGKELIASLSEAPAATALNPDDLCKRFHQFGPNVEKAGAQLIAKLQPDLEERRSRLDKLVPAVQSGDVRRGQIVFNSAKAVCSSCHAIGYVGGKIGPDLTRIGAIRSERDLLEAVLYPSASFVQGYEPWKATTTSGQSFSGILKKNAPDEIVLVISATEEKRLPRDAIDELVRSNVSVMPAGLEKQFTAEELNDLIAFLKACR